MAMSRIIVVFKDSQFMPLSFDESNHYWSYEVGKTFAIIQKKDNKTVLIVPWENLNYFYVSEEE